MKKKKLKCLGFVGLLFWLIMTGGVKADVIVNQVVDNSCNENDLCEVDLGETVATCPNDCHSGGTHPDFIQQALIKDNAIEIFDIEISIVDGILTIFWKTNKPAVSTLVLEDGMGGTEGGYLDDLYLTEHNIVIDDFGIAEDFEFEIFSKSIYNNDIYEYIDSFKFVLPERCDEVVLVDEDIDEGLPEDIPVGEDVGAIVGIGVIKEDSQILKDGVVIFDDGEYVGEIEQSSFNFGEWIKKYLLGMDEQKYMMGVWGGIILLLVTLFL